MPSARRRLRRRSHVHFISLVRSGRAPAHSPSCTPAWRPSASSVPLWKDDLIEGLLTEGAASVFRGEFTGQSSSEINVPLHVAALDIGLHVAAGNNWCGRRAQRGGVVFVLNSFESVRMATAAWKQEHGFVGADFPCTVIYPGNAADAPDLLQRAAKGLRMPVRLVISFGPTSFKARLLAAVQEQGAHLMWVDTNEPASARVNTRMEFALGDFAPTIIASTFRDVECVATFHFKLATIEVGRRENGGNTSGFVMRPIPAVAGLPQAPGGGRE